ncbi:MAG: DUF6427 family protein [Saprospiraceae bacterium]
MTKVIFDNLNNGLAQQIIANVLIFIQALLICNISLKHKLANEGTLFSGALYVLFVSLFVSNSSLTPALIANTFLILAISSILETYKVSDAVSNVFNTGFFLGSASLIYPPYIISFVFGFIGLAIIYTMRFRESLQYIIGYFIPFALVWVASLFFSPLSSSFQVYLKNVFKYTLPQTLTYIDIIGLVIIGISFLGILLLFNRLTYKKTIQSQKKIEIIYFLLFTIAVGFGFMATHDFEILVGLALPLSILIGIYISESKSKILYELYHLILVGYIYLSYFNIFNI